MVEGFVRDYEFRNNVVYLKCQFYSDGDILTTGRDGNYDYIQITQEDVNGKDKNEILNFIQQLVKKRCRGTILAIYKKNMNENPKIAHRIRDNLNLKNQFDTYSQSIKTISDSATSARFLIDSDYDDFYDKEITIFDDDKISEKVITPIPIGD